MVLEAKLPASLKEKWNLKKQKNPEATSNVLDFDDWISAKALTKEDTKNVFVPLRRKIRSPTENQIKQS
jgi:hypothetical protein